MQPALIAERSEGSSRHPITSAIRALTRPEVHPRKGDLPAAYFDAEYAKRECRLPATDRKRHGAPFQSDTGRGESSRKVGLAPDCRPAISRRPQGCRCNAQPALRPRFEECTRLCSASQLWRSGKNLPWPWLTCVRGQMERLTHLLEDIAFGNAAYISLVNSSAQRCQLCLVEPLLALQSP